MRASEVVRVVELLQGAYPRQEIPKSTLSVYVMALADLDVEDCLRAVTRHVQTSKWFPTIAEIRELVAEAITELPEPEFAWREVREALGRDTAGQPVPAWSCPEIREAVAVLGWGTLVNTRNIAIERERWIKTYSRLRRQAIERVVAPNRSGALPGQLKLLAEGDGR